MENMQYHPHIQSDMMLPANSEPSRKQQMQSSTHSYPNSQIASSVELDLSKQGMQMLDKMNKDEQATFLEFQRRLQESNRVSTASSFIDVANGLTEQS